MGALQTAEKQIGEFFKGLPPLPRESKEALVKAWPWIALIFGVLQLMAGYWLFRAAQATTAFNDLANSLAQYTGTNIGLSAMDKTVMYAGVALLIVDGVILLMAYPHLKSRVRRGWDLLFLGALLNAAYAVLSAFMAQRGGASSLVFGLLSSAVAFYLLFQVKNHYSGTTTHKNSE